MDVFIIIVMRWQVEYGWIIDYNNEISFKLYANYKWYFTSVFYNKKC